MYVFSVGVNQTHDPGIATVVLYQLSYRSSITGFFLENSHSLKVHHFLFCSSFTLWVLHADLASLHFPSFYGPDAACFSILPGEAAWLLYFHFFVCTQGQETYTLWRICHVIPSESLSQRSPWSHWTPRAKVRPHQLKSLKNSCSAVMGSFLSCADTFPISISHMSVLRS